MTYSWEVVIRLRPMIFVTALAFIILSQPTQIVELYLIDIETVLGRLSGSRASLADAFAASAPMAIAAGLILLAVLVLWLASMHLASLTSDYRQWSRPKTILANAVMLATALAPLAGVILGLHAAKDQLPRIELQDPSELESALLTYIWAAYVLLAVSASALILLSMFAAGKVERLAHAFFTPVGMLAALSTPVLITVAILVAPTRLPGALGTVPIVMLFIAVLAFLLATFSHLYRLTGWPVTAIVTATAVVFAMLGWNDNHKVEYADGGAALHFQPGFNEWLQQRQDLGYYAERKLPYPVYIIAAEGGGMSAGYHLASTLARLQEACPTFAQHVFAISSVSGGSLGAAQFAAQVSASVKNGPWRPCAELGAAGGHSRNAREFFRTDFLAPLVAAALFPDLLQRFLPIPIGQLDRARGLEGAFAAKAADIWGAGASNPFAKSVHALWDPRGAAPALLLNTTSIEMGARVTISPLLFGVTPTALDLGILLCNGAKAIEMPLATSVSLSARAPWLTPAGWLEKNETWPTKECGATPRQGQKPDGPKRDRLYLVDGGYFENSGFETALEIASQLRAQARECQKDTSDKEEQRGGRIIITSVRHCSEAFRFGVDIRTIMIFAKDAYAAQFWGPFADLSSSRPNELWAPIRTLLNTGSARTRAVHIRQSSFDDDYTYMDRNSPNRVLEKANRYRVPGEIFLGTNELHHVILDGTRFFFPLGWRLSRRSMDNIQGANSEATRLTFEIIRRELMGEDTEALKRPPSSLTR